MIITGIRKLTSQHLAERILLLAIAGGLIIDGLAGGSFTSLSDETIVRITFSLLSGGAFAASLIFNITRPVMRWLAYTGIAVLILFSGFICYKYSFTIDDSLTFIGAYVICSMYFRSGRDLIIYLVAGLLLMWFVTMMTENPHIDTDKFLLRLFLGAILVFSLSWGSRLMQGRIVRISQEIEERGRELDRTAAILEERLTRDQLLAMVASRANAIVMITDRDDVIEWVNEEFTRITGYEFDEIVGKKPDVLRGPETDPETVKRINERKLSGISFHDELINYRKDGTPLWLQMHVTPLADADGEIHHFVAIQEDITESKRTSEELRRSRELLRAAQRQAKIGSWEWTEGSDTLNCSEEYFHLVGVPVTDELPIAHMRSILHPDDMPVVRQSAEDALRRNAPFEIDCRIVKGSQITYLFLTGQSSLAPNGKRRLVGTIQDITERKRNEEELRVAERQYRSLFEHSQHMICMHDLEGVILSINPAGAHALGYEPEELIGRQISKLVPERYRQEFERYIVEIRNHGMHSGLMRMTMRDGQESIWMYSNIRLTDPEGNPFVLSSNVEITSRYMMEKELRAAKKMADEALIAKDRFVANISHELRTPMNAIGGFSELLRKTKLDPDQKDYSDAIAVATDNLTAMINDILDVAKIEAGKIEFDRRAFKVREVLRKTHLLLSPKADQTGIRFTWSCDEKLPAFVVSDDLRLTQILMNLVGNAVKFTEKGFVSFGCDIAEETEKQFTLRFWVEDSGIGIPKEKLNIIFDPFSQVSASSNRKYAGTGLGLTIVKDLAELQGGSVRVQSAEGIGSRFEVLIPVEKIDRDTVDDVDVALKPIEHPGTIHILLVEDHPLNQQLALRLIRDFGFTASLASNGRAAIEVLKEERFDVILMDLQMPELDGYEATRVIRNKMQLTTPIIALTAHSSSGEREKCLELGMTDYMTKPYRSKELYYKITKAIGGKSESESGRTETEKQYSTPLKALAAGDRNFELDMLSTMASSFVQDFDRLNQAITDKDFTLVKSVAHRLKSALALAGEKEFTQWMEILEDHSEESDKHQYVHEAWQNINLHSAELIKRINQQIEDLKQY
ncbi:MAG: PAS domain S-box protein [Bacteroidia bacterium]|nr:PAS domain S-box protein [Bacteroidia bacterium]